MTITPPPSPPLLSMPLPNQTDMAWVRIATPLSTNWLREFCRELKPLFQLNPHLELLAWQPLGTHHYYLQARNLSNQQEINTELWLEETTAGFLIRYQQGLKTATTIQIEPTTAHTAALILIDDYSGSSQIEREQRLTEVDKSLPAWGHELYRYFQNWQRWAWCPLYRWYMRRIWQPMTPMARRVAYMLIVISLFELIAILGFLIMINSNKF